MKRTPLTKAEVKCGEPANAPCLGQEMIMSLMVSGHRQDGPCFGCHDWRNCRRVKRGEPILEPITENPVEVSM